MINTYSDPHLSIVSERLSVELKYAEQTIQKIVGHTKLNITSLAQYIQVNHVSDASVIWESLIEVDSFRNLKSKKKRKNKEGKDSTADFYSKNSFSQDATTLSSTNPPVQSTTNLITQNSSLPPPSQVIVPSP